MQKITTKYDFNPPISSDFDPSWGVPDILVMTCLVPFEVGPALWGKHPEDDYGATVVVYFQLNEESKRKLKSGKPCHALKLFQDFILQGKSDKSGIPLKMIAHCSNIDDLDLPGMVKGYNAKPVLVTGSASFGTKKMPEVLEIEFDMRIWAYLCRSQLPNILQKYVPKAKMCYGWLCEGRGDERLPEQMLGCVGVDNFDFLNSGMSVVGKGP